jgi:hypothetical protein
MDETNSASTERTMSAHRETHRPILGRITPSGSMVRKVLLALGIVGPLFYVATDILLATRWKGYSYTDQTVSELFAIGASTRPLAVLLMLTYGVLAIAFGLGVWASAGEKRALRVVAVGLIGKEVLGIVATLFAPIHLREALAAGEGTSSDAWHGILTFGGALCYLLAMGFGATAFGKRFRLYSIATMLILVAFGVLTGLDQPQLAANLPTPWMGLWERIDIFTTMLWIAVLAITLLRAQAIRPQDSSNISSLPSSP